MLPPTGHSGHHHKAYKQKCRGERGEKGNVLCCLGECKLVTATMEDGMKFLRKLKLGQPHDLEIPLLGLYAEKNHNSKRHMHSNFDGSKQHTHCQKDG